jgi:glycosyltransferase involved in cell wall biosynthesis
MYLEHCLASISAQSYKNLEIIIVDDGSTDGSGAICDAYAERDSRCIVVHQENQGLWAARNTGQKIAKGDFIMFVDSDDYIHVDMINSLYDALMQNPQCDLALCNYRTTVSFDEDTHVPFNDNYQVLSLDQVLRFDNQGLVDFVWNKLYRRSLLDGLFARNYRTTQDVDFNIRVFALVNYAVFVDNEYYFWMKREDSTMRRKDYWYTYLTIVTDIYYRNYYEILDKNRIVSSHLLASLYWRLLSLKSYAWGTDKAEIASLKCKQVMKETWRSYLCCRRVSLLKRLYVFLLLCLPSVILHRIKVIRFDVKQTLSNYRNR